MDDGKLGDEPLTAFAAGDDATAKADVLALEREIGFDAIDAGPLGYLNIQLGYGPKMGTDTGFKLMHGQTA
jgi:8-hydroxy-5-deazaflavin:NADPH oxidoreductase